MITDDMLRNAAAKANDALLSTLPSPKDCEHIFSRRFERKMRKLIRHTKYPIVYNVLKTAACFILVSILAAAMFLTANVQAREAFFKWVKEQYEYFIEYYFDGMVSDEVIENNEMAEYRLGWVPEGYVESEVYKSLHKITIVYTNTTDDAILFTYHNNQLISNVLFYDDSLYNFSSIAIDSSIADIYISTTPAKANSIIINNDDVLFHISAILDQDDLIKMANSIYIFNNN